MRMILIPVYKYAELPENIKGAVREKWREWTTQDRWYDQTYQHIQEVGEALGIEFDSKGVDRPAIYFSGFSSQGDGACFEGKYAYAKQAPKRIAELCGAESPMIDLATRLAAAQKKHFYKITATVRHAGYYQNSANTAVDVEVNGNVAERDLEHSIMMLLREFMDWSYSELENEYNYLTSDAEIEQQINDANHEFTADGRIVSVKELGPEVEPELAV